MSDQPTEPTFYAGKDLEGNPIEFNLRESDLTRHSKRERRGWSDFVQDAANAVLYYRHKIKQLEGRVEYLKKVAYGFGSFRLDSSEEVSRARAFIAKHKMHGQPGRETFTPVSSIEWRFQNTGVGSIVKVHCTHCKATEDITDVDCW